MYFTEKSPQLVAQWKRPNNDVSSTGVEEEGWTDTADFNFNDRTPSHSRGPLQVADLETPNQEPSEPGTAISQPSNYTTRTPSTANRSLMFEAAFPVPYKCLVGALQRLVLMVPDRAPTRSLAADSVLKILAVSYKAVEGLAGQPQPAGNITLL